MTPGRKKKYDSHVSHRLEAVQAWRRMGLTEKEVAENLGISQTSLTIYKREFPAFAAALKEGQDDATAAVVNAHFRSAVGYEYEERKFVYDIGPDGKPKERPSKLEIVKKQVQPSVAAQIHILKNRDCSNWNRETQRHEHTGKDGGPIESKAEVLFYLPDNGRDETRNFHGSETEGD